MARRLGLGLMGIVLFAGIAAATPAIHPLLKPLLETGPAAQAIPPVLALSGSGGTGEAEKFGVWVRTRDGGRALESLGLLPPSGLATLRSARWTRSDLRAAAAEPSVISIGPAVRCFATLDSSLVDIGARRVHGPHGIPPIYDGPTGDSIIVGIVDTGIDLQHDDFHLPNGNTRIVALWDQTNPTSTGHPAGFDYGKEWTMAQINAGLCDENDVIGHGTHVAGIAAGNGSATGNGQAAYRYVGMAPDAQIVFVKSDFASSSIVDGVNYIFQKAAALHLPAVVNLSLGTQYGPHDGTDDISVGIAQLTGMGKVVVAAAGNDQGKGVHAHRIVSARSDTAQVTLSVSPYAAQPGTENDVIDLDGWYNPIVPLAVTIVTPGGTSVGPVSMGSASSTNTPDGHVLIDNSHGVNGDREVSIELIDQSANQPPASGIWKIEVSGGAVPPADSTSFEVWNFYQTMSSHVGFLYGAEDKDIVLSPATGDSVIATGAYVTRLSWVAENGTQYNYSPPLPHGALAPFSSIGYRRDGVIKPEISAPGRGVAASLSSSASGIDPHLVVEDGVHVVFEGTSMASPHVAGCVALMFQKLGPHGVRETRSQLIVTAKADAFTGTVPNGAWGYGKLDAIRAVGFNEPVVLVEAEAHQDGDRMVVRFLLSDDAGTAPFPVLREDDASSGRTMLGWSSEGHERTFVDSTLVQGGDYVYWLDASNGGEEDWIGPVRGHFVPARRLSLETSPNPFLAKTSIRWLAPASAGVITIHDVTGRRIRRFDCGPRTAGTIVWDGTDATGHPVAAGLYLAKLSSGASSVERRILRLR